MKNQIAIAAAITASFALWAAVLPQTAVDKETPNTRSNRDPGTASRAACPTQTRDRGHR